ncbi:AAA family ATPase [Methylobacterium radiotolerans]|uniref:AAA family ATPase n=1 Tax=Methylobacterium radiotolerans TaxID=31998 RepID=UPI0038CF3E1E
MTAIADFLPSESTWSLDWDGIDAAYPWIRSLRGAAHDPIHHREGDVWTHVRMVTEELVADPEWRGLPEDLRLASFAAALLHDVAKPATASAEIVDGVERIHHHGHSRAGAVMARGILWRQDFEPRLREIVCSLIARHQTPFWLHERDYEDARRIVAGQSLTSGNRLLAILARADARGRICDDRDMMELAVEEYRAIAAEHECLDAPFLFAGERERFLYLSRRGDLDPRFPIGAPGDRPEVVLMSALPGAGKSTWIARNAGDRPVISLDEIRRALRIGPEKSQGPVLEAGKEAAKAHLRAKTSFVWDTTGVTRDLREKMIGLAFDYGFAIRIVALEAPFRELLRRNREREHPVPTEVIERLVGKWDHPDLSECDRLEAPALEAPRALPSSSSEPRMI